MNNTLTLRKNLTIFGIPIFIIGMMMCIAKSSLFIEHANNLSIGITFDLLVTVPLVYFVLIRKTSIPKTTVVPFLIVGFVVCTMILPSQNQYYLDLFKTWILPVIEISIVSYVIYKVSRAVKRFKLEKNKKVDFFMALKKTCYEILPRAVVIPVVTEIAVLYYGFIAWKKRKLSENEFSYHKDSGTVSLLIAILFVIAIETVVFHILLAKWSIVAAWILTSLSIYSGVQVLGFVKSMYKRPISIEKNKLFLRYGIMNETTIDIANIDSIELSTKEIEFNEETRKLSFLGELESHNTIICLKEENILTGLYGIKRKYRNLALHIDNKTEFKDQIDIILQQT